MIGDSSTSQKRQALIREESRVRVEAVYSL